MPSKKKNRSRKGGAGTKASDPGAERSASSASLSASPEASPEGSPQLSPAPSPAVPETFKDTKGPAAESSKELEARTMSGLSVKDSTAAELKEPPTSTMNGPQVESEEESTKMAEQEREAQTAAEAARKAQQERKGEAAKKEEEDRKAQETAPEESRPLTFCERCCGRRPQRELNEVLLIDS